MRWTTIVLIVMACFIAVLLAAMGLTGLRELKLLGGTLRLAVPRFAVSYWPIRVGSVVTKLYGLLCAMFVVATVFYFLQLLRFCEVGDVFGDRVTTALPRFAIMLFVCFIWPELTFERALTVKVSISGGDIYAFVASSTLVLVSWVVKEAKDATDAIV